MASWIIVQSYLKRPLLQPGCLTIAEGRYGDIEAAPKHHPREGNTCSKTPGLFKFPPVAPPRSLPRVVICDGRASGAGTPSGATPFVCLNVPPCNTVLNQSIVSGSRQSRGRRVQPAELPGRSPESSRLESTSASPTLIACRREHSFRPDGAVDFGACRVDRGHHGGLLAQISLAPSYPQALLTGHPGTITLSYAKRIPPASMPRRTCRRTRGER